MSACELPSASQNDAIDIRVAYVEMGSVDSGDDLRRRRQKRSTFGSGLSGESYSQDGRIEEVLSSNTTSTWKPEAKNAQAISEVGGHSRRSASGMGRSWTRMSNSRCSSDRKAVARILA